MSEKIKNEDDSQEELIIDESKLTTAKTKSKSRKQEKHTTIDSNASENVDKEIREIEVKEEAIAEAEIDFMEELKGRYKGIGSISIRPYVNANKENMGLEKYGYVVFPGTHQMEDMACVVFRGKLRYLNGLDEYAASVQAIKDPERKLAKVKEIRTIVARLEAEKTFNHIDINDKEFWNKVDTFRPDNGEVWGSMAQKCNNDPIFLDPVNNTEHLLAVLAIENGGYPGIAKSFEDAKSGRRDKKWYLDKQSDTVGNRATSSKLKDKALGMMNNLSEENPRKLLFVAKLVDENSMQYHYGTLDSIVYDEMDAYITGEGVESNIKNAANLFMSYASMSQKELKIRSAIKDASFYKYIVTKGDGMIYTKSNNTMLGRNTSEVYEFLNNPLNERTLDELLLKVEKTWKK